MKNLMTYLMDSVSLLVSTNTEVKFTLGVSTTKALIDCLSTPSTLTVGKSMKTGTSQALPNGISPKKSSKTKLKQLLRRLE